MKKALLALAFLPIIVTNNSSASVETKVTNEVSGENASVKTEINNVVNQKSVNVKTTGPGTIKVEIKDGQVNIESDQEIAPTIVISLSSEEMVEELETEVQAEIEEIEEEKTVAKIITSFFKSIFSRFARFFRIKLDNQ